MPIIRLLTRRSRSVKFSQTHDHLIYSWSLITILRARARPAHCIIRLSVISSIQPIHNHRDTIEFNEKYYDIYPRIF